MNFSDNKKTMLTLFTIPKGFKDPHIALIQTNAIESWLHLDPKPEIILFGNDPGVAEFAEKKSLRHLPDVKTNSHGTPLVNDIFNKAQSMASTNLTGYVNADILLMQDFMDAALLCAGKTHSFMMIGRRWDLDLKTNIEFSPGWEDTLRNLVKKDAVLHNYTGMDYFVFPHDMIDRIPPFAIGRTVWDAWLVYRARKKHMKVIDATKRVWAVHQNHPYPPNFKKGQDEVWKGQEAMKNLELAGGPDHRFSLMDCTHFLDDSEISRFTDKEHRQRWKNTLPLIFPFLWLPFRVLSRFTRLLNQIAGKTENE